MAWGKSPLLTVPLLLSGIFVVASPAVAEQVGSSTDWTSVSAGGSHTCGIRSGKLYCWGNNDSGQVGNGDIDDAFQTSPDRIGSSDGWSAVSAGSSHTCGINNRKLYCWGSDSDNQLGNGSAGNQRRPQLISGAAWNAVSAGAAHTCAIRSDEILACWGSDEHQQVGNGANQNPPSVPTLVSAAHWKSISAGAAHTCGVRTDGMLACWGSDSGGQIGNGSLGEPSVPARISGGTWKSVSAGRAHSCAIRSDNLLACWGSDGGGQIGNGSGGSPTVPVKITSVSDWRVVSAGGEHTCATRGTGALYCWGDNTFGQVTGSPSTSSFTTPKRYGNYSYYRGTEIGSRTSCSVRANGELHCWGGIDPPVTCAVEPYVAPGSIDLSYWKLTTPIDADNNGEADEVRYTGPTSGLAVLNEPEYFENLNGGAGPIRFRARSDGATTSGSVNPRSELREMTPFIDGQGYRNAAWDPRLGVHRMLINQSINYTLTTKREVVAGQIHDAADDMLQVRLEYDGQNDKNKLLVEAKNGEPYGILDDDYSLGTAFDILIQADRCGVTVQYNPATTNRQITVPFGDGEIDGTWYFKAGDYTQSYVDGSRYGEVTVYGLDVTHS